MAINKVDVTGENFALIHRTMLPGHEAEEQTLTPTIQELLKKVDVAQAALDEKTILGLTDEAAKMGFKLENLTNDEKDGGWSAGYNNIDPKIAVEKGAISRGSGTTPALMGFGDDEDKLVIIADADEKGTNLVAYWRNEIPTDFKKLTTTTIEETH